MTTAADAPIPTEATTETLVPETPVSETSPEVPETDEKQSETPDTPVVPEEYGDFTLPEGWEIADDDLSAFVDIAKSMELDQGNAQKLVDLFIGVEGGRVESLEAYKAEVDQQRDAQWQEQLHKDPEIGGEKFADAQAAISTLEDSGALLPEFTEALIESGYYKHPGVIKQLAAFGRAMREQPTMFGNASGGLGDGKTPAQRMFTKSGHV